MKTEVRSCEHLGACSIEMKDIKVLELGLGQFWTRVQSKLEAKKRNIMVLEHDFGHVCPRKMKISEDLGLMLVEIT